MFNVASVPVFSMLLILLGFCVVFLFCMFNVASVPVFSMLLILLGFCVGEYRDTGNIEHTKQKHNTET
jgi:F0F1-type ATP synthase assembly protein I